MAILLTSTISFAANPKCPTGTLTLTKKASTIEWSLASNSVHTKWLMIENKDTKRWYPRTQMTKSKGVLRKSEFEKNQNGYKLVVIEASNEETAEIKKDLSTCSKRKDCSLKVKLNRCIIDKKDL